MYSDEQGISSANAGLTDAPCPSILPMRKEIAGNVEFLKV